MGIRMAITIKAVKINKPKIGKPGRNVSEPGFCRIGRTVKTDANEVRSDPVNFMLALFTLLQSMGVDDGV